VPPRSSDPRPSWCMLLAGAPEIASSVRERIAQTAPEWALRSSEHAAAEMTLLADEVDPEHVILLQGAELTEERLREHLPSASVVHFAAPFRVNGASPLFSSVLLGGEPGHAANRSATDAVLDAREVMNLDLQAALAVVSDGAAMAMREASDEAAVVQWAWRAAGVPALVLPRWSGDDEASREFLVEFYRRVHEGDSAAAALHTASAAIRRKEGRSAPFYWAGWLLIAGR
ncbi:MAG TPA: CHAT domain-containing protein, partial [Vicinamibacterales bacterium]|nr:CHAT domain-containing protein [Vicinamibacterales bacterium]